MMINRLHLITAVLLTMLLGWVWQQASAQQGQTTTGVQRLTTTDSGVSFSLHSAPAIITAESVTAVGLNAAISQPGAPNLPSFTTLIALPPDGDIAITVQATASHRQTATVAPVPTYTSPDSSQLTAPTEAHVTADTAVYHSNALFPATRYTLSAPMYIRDLRVAALTLYPVRFNPVTRQLMQEQLQVNVTFSGNKTAVSTPGSSPLPTAVLNPEQAQQWRQLPADFVQQATNTFPTAADHIYKITVDQPGIYEIAISSLSGLTPDTYSISDLAMLYRGDPVAYEYDDVDSNSLISSGDLIRFYGFPFNGSKQEAQFINGTRQPDGFLLQNVFWLTIDPTNSGSIIPTNPNQPGAGIPATATAHTVVWEPEDYFFSTWTDDWPTFPNEPDAWYADYLTSTTNGVTITRTYAITTPHPATSGSATLSLELMPRENQTFNRHDARIALNDNPVSAITTFYGATNTNIVQTVPATAVLSGTNTVTLALVDTYNGERVYLNDINLTYPRNLIADNQQLIFSDEVGTRPLQISGFTGADTATMRVWNITNPLQPSATTLTPGDLSGGSITIGGSQPANSRYLITTLNNAIPATASRYTPVNLTPTGGSAQWLAITHANFTTAANTLAAHRRNSRFGGFTTHVATIDAIVNQYGWGLPLPAAIRAYLSDALANWGTQYVTLFGDATAVPRATYTPMPCPVPISCSTGWDASAPTYLPTDLIFIDRYQGMIPTDHTFATLIGNDILPDLAVGRIPAESLTEATAIVNKIILYETSWYNQQPWHTNMVFVADNTDAAGDFHAENVAVANALPDIFNITHLTLSDVLTATQLRDDLGNQINNIGTAVLNYRGHGAIFRWADEGILTSSDADIFWLNPATPTVIISADCLDGYFAYPGVTGLGEAFLKPTNRGTAAHWASTGLGTTYEHTILVNALYDGMFNLGHPRLGDAINHAKTHFFAVSNVQSELYSFTLLGDPAMRLFTPFENQLYLPAIIR